MTSNFKKMLLITPELFDRLKQQQQQQHEITRSPYRVTTKPRKKKKTTTTTTKKGKTGRRRRRKKADVYSQWYALRQKEEKRFKKATRERKPVIIPFVEEPSTPPTLPVTGAVQPTLRIQRRRNLLKRKRPSIFRASKKILQNEEGGEPLATSTPIKSLSTRGDETIYESPGAFDVSTASNTSRLADYEDFEFLEDDLSKRQSLPDLIDFIDYLEPRIGKLATEYLIPIHYQTKETDPVYGIRRDGNDYKIGDTVIHLDDDNHIVVKDTRYKLTRGLWELLGRNIPNKNLYNDLDLEKYRDILLNTGAHLDSTGKIKSNSGYKYTKFIRQLIAGRPVVIKERKTPWTNLA